MPTDTPAQQCQPDKKKRRYRPPPPDAPPYRICMRSESGTFTTAFLDVPAEDEQCPLTISPIAEDELDFLPGVTYMVNKPLARRIKLSCSHAFGAMNLLYHFARRDMRCPCCRAGKKSRLDVRAVPMHFRVALVARIEAQTRADAEEQTRADEAIARDLGRFEDPTSLMDTFMPMLGGQIVNMTVYVHSSMSVDTHSSASGMEFTLSPAPVNNNGNADVAPGFRTIFVPGTADRRMLNEIFEDTSVTFVSLVAHTRSATNRVVELARTDTFLLRSPPPWNGGVYRTIAAQHTFFDILPLGDSRGNVFVRWRF